MEPVSFNNFTPDWDIKTPKSNAQLKFEDSISLHLLVLNLQPSEVEMLVSAFRVWMVEGPMELGFGFLTDNNRIAIVEKAKNAVYAAEKFCESHAANVNSLHEKAISLFRGFISFRDEATKHL